MINVRWGTGETAGICFFHDDKCKQPGVGIAHGERGEDCVDLHSEQDAGHGSFKGPWNSAKFWHGESDELNKAPCKMTQNMMMYR